MNNIYILHAGAKIIEEAISTSIYRDNITSINPYLNSRVLRTLRRIHFKSKIKSKKIWVNFLLNKYKIKNNSENTIIVFDAPIWMENISYIRKKYTKVKIIFWYWNIVKDKDYLKNIIKNSDAVFTFDEEDMTKYNLKYHPQFYWIKEKKSEKILYDILFIGRNKKRIKFLEKIYLNLIDKNLKPYFYIIKDNNKDRSEHIKLQTDELSYNSVLDLISKSRAILDINQDNQVGLTLRVLEALFLKKKLITNNNLLKYDFYNANNIEIIDNDFYIKTDIFKTSFQEIDESIIEKYTFDHWLTTLNNFGE